MTTRQAQHQELDRKLHTYDEQFPYWRENELMCKWYPERVLRLKPGNSILELGVGRGYSTEVFSQAFQRHVVVEGSRAQIDRYRERFTHQPSEMIHSLFEDFQTSERFDCIMFGFVLEMLDNPLSVLKHFRQFLTPGGVVFITTPNAETLNKRIALAAGLIDSYTRLSEAQTKKGVNRIYTVQTLTDLAKQAGYVPTLTEGIYLKPIPLSAIEKLGLSDDVLRAMCIVGVDYPELCNGFLMRLAVDA